MNPLSKFALFGFTISRNKKEEDQVKQQSFAPPTQDDGAITMTSAAYYGVAVDMDGTAKNEIELISRYREMSMQPEIESAIDDIVNEAICQDDDGKTINIVMDNLDQPDRIKAAIKQEFENILKLMNYNNMAVDIFRRYYVDGRLYYHILIDRENPTEGIKELRYVDPRKIRKVREIKKKKDDVTGADIQNVINEYYIYNDKVISGSSSNFGPVGVRITTDSIIAVQSGLMDSRRSIVLSFLHKAIKPLNQLRMIEDATVIYRISRAPERRIFYIDVGNLPKLKAEQYLRDIMVKYKNKLVYDSCLVMDTKVPLLDGRVLTISEISKELELGNRLWAYSCDPKTGKFAPGLITWAGVTRKNTDVVKITLDNGETITCTPDHKFPVWNKGFVEAKDLQNGESLIPFYTREEKVNKKKVSKYQQIYQNDTKKWEFTHRLVSKWKDSFGMENELVFNEKFSNSKKQTIHHVNYNRHDNTPENLVRMNHVDHLYYHGNNTTFQNLPKEKLLEISKKGSIALNKKLQDPEYNQFFRKQLSNGWSDESKSAAADRGKNRPVEHFVDMNKLANDARWNSNISEAQKEKLSKSQSIEYPNNIKDLIIHCCKMDYKMEEGIRYINTNIDKELWNQLNVGKPIKQRNANNDFTVKDLYRICGMMGHNGYKNLKKEIQLFNNHKVVSVEVLSDKMDVGTLTIDGEEQYHDYHTFALSSCIYTKNSTGEITNDRKYMSMMEDFWLPRREGGKGTEITTLPGGQNLGELEDVKYFERKLYKSLNVPISRLEPNQGFTIGRVAEVTRDELKFSKFVSRLRNKFSEVFDQTLRVQCVLKGICTDDEWTDFKEHIFYDYIQDNNFTEMKDAELMKERLGLLSQVDPYTGRYYSQAWIQKKVLRLSKDEIKEMETEMEEEKKLGLGLPVSVTNPVAQQQLSGDIEMQQQATLNQHQSELDSKYVNTKEEYDQDTHNSPGLFNRIKEIL